MDLEAIRTRLRALFWFSSRSFGHLRRVSSVGTNMENAAYPEGICAEGAASSARQRRRAHFSNPSASSALKVSPFAPVAGVVKNCGVRHARNDH